MCVQSHLQLAKDTVKPIITKVATHIVTAVVLLLTALPVEVKGHTLGREVADGKRGLEEVQIQVCSL